MTDDRRIFTRDVLARHAAQSRLVGRAMTDEPQVTEAMIDKAWADFVNCRSDEYFGKRDKLDKQKDVLRKFAAEVLAAARPTVGEEELVEEFLAELDGWEAAYPLSAFPEPDLKKAAAVLKANGMTLDAISASNMRHVVSKIAPKARAALSVINQVGR